MDLTFLLKALDSSDVGAFITDRNGQIEWVSAGFTRITGYASEEILGKNPRVFKSSAHSQYFFSELWNTLLAGRSWRGSVTNRHKNGKAYSCLQTIAPVFGNGGEISHFISFMQEVGAGRVLQETNDRYYSLLESLGDGVVSSTADGLIRMANPAAARVLGMPRDMLLGRDLISFVHEDDRALVKSEMDRRRPGERRVYEFRIVRPDDGAVRTIQVTATPEYDSQRTFRGLLGVFRDVTVEREMEQRLRLLAHTLESVDESVVICGPDDRMLFVNRAFVRTYGYEEKELLGQHISMVRSPLGPDPVVSEILPSTLAGGWRGELWNRRKDGSDFLVMLTTAAVKDDTGRLEATVGVVRDITEERRFQAELQRAKEQAEAANRAKNEFLATMSHEIRTPMNGVIGMASLLLDTKLSDAQRDYAETVRRSGESLLTILSDILDFSRMEAGRLAIADAPLDLFDVIEDVRRIGEPEARAAGLELSVAYGASLPRRFRGDAGRIRQVVMNLVNNALKFTPTGAVRVEVECEEAFAEAARIRISVRDTGVGIPEDKQHLIFDKFSQVDSSNTRKYGGTGLGLAIARQLVELMGGRIGLESRVGQGSTFWVSLPLRLQSQAIDPPAPGAATQSELWPGLRVLLVEDNPVNQKVAAGMLKRLGLTTDVAYDGSEALDKCARGCYDLVLMDCQMPVMDGYTATSELRRQNGPLARVPIIAITADAREGTRQRCLDAGMNDYIVKPIKINILRETIRKWAPAPANQN